VVHSTGARHAINLISAVTAKGALRFAAYEGTPGLLRSRGTGLQAGISWSE
jgi:hypothetical protein